MKISVALCVYNGSRYLEHQLKSILEQTVPVEEIIVCDDRSVDNTVSIVKKFQHEHPGIIKLYVNELQLGAKQNFEQAISLATGDYVFLSDQDDVWRQDKVEVFMRHFNAYPEYSGFFSNGMLIDEQGKDLNIELWSASFFDKDFRDHITDEKNLFCHLLLYGNVVTGATLAFNKKAKEQILPLRHMDIMWHDSWISLSLSAKSQLGWISEPLVWYRIHGKQQVGLRDTATIGRNKERRLRDLKNQLSKDEIAGEIKRRRKSYYFLLKTARSLPEAYQHLELARTRYRESKKAYLSRLKLVDRIVKYSKWYISDMRHTKG